MKVFISHSWKNKTQVQKLADELQQAGIELWLDAMDLLPGQTIQPTIDSVLEKIDVVILVWTKEASASNGVAAEIYSCSKLQKIIIPCNMDDTPMTNFPYLQQIKGIHFKDFADGVGRLKMTLLNYMAKEFGMDGNDSIRSMNQFLGTLETASHLVHNQNIKETGSADDKDYWVNKIGNTEKSSYEKLKEEERIGKTIMTFLQDKVKDLEKNLYNKNECGRILQEMKSFEYSNHPAMKEFVQYVQNTYDSFKEDPVVSVIEKYREEMKEKLASSKQQLKTNFGWLLPDFLFQQAFDNISYFYLNSADNLERLIQLSQQSQTHPIIADISNELLSYIKTPGGVIDNNLYGILGYADDAYLIQSMLASLQQEGAVDTTAWMIDWNKIQAGCELVFNIIGNNIRVQLDQNIVAFCQALAQKYNPAPAQNSHQQQLNDLQKAKDDLWKAKLMSLETAMIHNPVW